MNPVDHEIMRNTQESALFETQSNIIVAIYPFRNHLSGYLLSNWILITAYIRSVFNEKNPIIKMYNHNMLFNILCLCYFPF